MGDGNHHTCVISARVSAPLPRVMKATSGLSLGLGATPDTPFSAMTSTAYEDLGSRLVSVTVLVFRLVLPGAKVTEVLHLSHLTV